jgi:putative membrane protein
MVAAGHWAFGTPAPGLPGTDGIPLTNHAGWALVALVMVAALDRVVPGSDGAHEGVIAVLLGWTWIGSALANAAFFGRPAVAVWGGLAMGVPVAVYLRRLWLSPAASRVEP